MHPLRICFVGWGDHVHTERWVSRFVGAEFDLSVISFSGRGQYPASVRQFDLMALPLNSHRLRMLGVRLLLRYLRPDIVHVHYAGFLLNVAPLWRGKTVVTVWGSDVYRAHILTEDQQAQIAWHLAKADCVTCDSADLKEAIGKFCEGAKPRTEIVQWGVDTSAFSPGSAATDIVERFGLQGRTVFISPRNFYPLYRLTDIVEAFARVVAIRADAVLVMKRYNADPDYTKIVEGMIETLGLSESVFIVDRVEYSEMVDFYRSGSIMISVPESDGTPMSLLEGMACGCLPIVSDLPSLREWIIDGVNGRIVPIGDVDALADAMLELADSEQGDAIRTRNVTLVQTQGSQAASTSHMKDVYRRIVCG